MITHEKVLDIMIQLHYWCDATDCSSCIYDEGGMKSIDCKIMRSFFDEKYTYPIKELKEYCTRFRSCENCILQNKDTVDCIVKHVTPSSYNINAIIKKMEEITE